MSINNMSNPIILFGKSWKWEVICNNIHSDDIKHLSDNFVVKYISEDLCFFTFNLPSFDESMNNQNILALIENENAKGKIAMFYSNKSKDLENYKDYSLIRI